MHQFLSDGLGYLFEGKKDKVEVCLVNPENAPFDRIRSETHWNNLPNSPAKKLSQILGIVAPGMRWSGYGVPRKREDGEITLVKDFEAFIKTQMNTSEV